MFAMTKVAGADGCKTGWFVVVMDIPGGRASYFVARGARELFDRTRDVEVLGIDVPIGLLSAAAKGGRPADIEARALLGPDRARSVFSPPSRRALEKRDYEAAKAANIASSPAGISLSRQAFGIMDKIREVDSLMTPELQERVREVHPELSFQALNGGERLIYGKKSHAGFLERYSLLKKAGFEDLLNPASFDCHVPSDDVLDACACCATARRIHEGKELRIPERPARDEKGLRMEIWR